VGGCQLKQAKPSDRATEGLFSRFLRSQLRRIGLGHPLRARPRGGQAFGTVDAVPEPEEIATEAPAPDTGASASTSLPSRSLPKEDLGIPRRPVDRLAEPTPLQRSWMSPLGARPLADRFQTTTRRKSSARSVTFLRGTTIPILVTSLNGLTGQP